MRKTSIKTIICLILSALIIYACSDGTIVDPATKISQSSPERPNILWLSVEDISDHLGVYGFEHAITPNLDAMAAEGIRFENAYAPAPVCAVARSSLITGVYSVAQGSQFMRTDIMLAKEVKPFPWYLHKAGYFTSNRKKTDYQFELPVGTWDFNNPDHKDYQERQDKTQPFFSVINFTGTHESRNRGEFDADMFDPAELELPGFYPDTPKVRRFWASYYQNVNKADTFIGEQLARLEEAGLAENTIVVFWSDHGVGFPRGKRWIYNLGLKVPMIVYIPEKWRARLSSGAAGTVNSELVNFIDFAPTMLSLAGVELPAYLQGRVMLGPDKAEAPQYLFAHRDRMDERVDIIRTMIGKRYKYIRNFEYFKPRLHYQEYAETHEWNGITAEIRRLHKTPGTSPEADWFFQYKPVEELYDLSKDPDELLNLAADPEFSVVLETMRGELQAHQQSIGDLGAIPESLLRRWRHQYGSEYEIRIKAPERVAVAWQVLRNLHKFSTTDLQQYSSSDNAAVRYWAAIGLGNLVVDESVHADIRSTLQPMLEDSEVIVQVAAARGMLLLQDSPEALHVLATIISDTSLDPADHLAAMLAIDLAGRRAIPLIEVMQAAQFGKKYPRRVRDELLPRIEQSAPRVPPLPEAGT